MEVAPVVEYTGVDALRWYYARRCRTRSDGDISLDAIVVAHDSDLADRLGNLVQRSTALAVKLAAGRVARPHVESAETAELRAHAEALPGRVDGALAAFLLDDAVAAILELVDAANRTLERTAPWRAGLDPQEATDALYGPLEAARLAAGELSPFVPGVSRAIAARLGEPDLQRGWGCSTPAVLRIGPPPVPRKRRRAP